MARVIGSLIGNDSAKTLTLTESANPILVYHVTESGITLLADSQYSITSTTLTLNFTPQQNELILVTTDGKLLFADLYVFSNLAQAEQRSIVDEFYIHADTSKIVNLSITGENYSAPPNAPNVQFAFSITNSNFTPSLVISEIPKNQTIKVYCKATVPANLQINSFINYSIVIEAQEVPD